MDLFVCCCPRASSSAISAGREVNRAAEFRRAIKILLLGTGESGKSTVLKQMKILHVQGFSDREKKEQVTVIRHNVHDSLCEIIRNVRQLGLQFDTSENEQRGQEIVNCAEAEILSEVYVEQAKVLILDEGFKCCLGRCNEYQLMDNARYFLDRVSEISSPGYCPTTEDILHSRTITTGYNEVRFKIKVPRSSYSQEFRMFDVGGQREERRKWIHVFDGIEALLFIISCCDFDQSLREEKTTNRLMESIEMFHRVWHNGMLTGAGIICFLNKQDLMEQKIRNGHRISAEHFPDYATFDLPRRAVTPIDPVSLECERTRQFIRERLVQVTKEPPRRLSNRSDVAKRDCYFHYTTATDSGNIRRVFGDVHDMILQQMLSRVDLM